MISIRESEGKNKVKEKRGARTKKSSLTAIMGALEQAPRHSTSTRVNLLSLVVCPGWMPRCEVMVSRILVEPQPPSMHGVVVQSWRKFLPTGDLNELRKSAPDGCEGRRSEGRTG